MKNEDKIKNAIAFSGLKIETGYKRFKVFDPYSGGIQLGWIEEDEGEYYFQPKIKDFNKDQLEGLYVFLREANS